MRFLASIWAGSLVSLSLVAACGGSTAGDDGGGGVAGSGGSSSGGASTGGSSSGGTSAGGSSSGGAAGSAGAAGGGGGATCGSLACAKPSDCTFVVPSCCLCGMPELDDFLVVNDASAASCGCTGPACACALATNPNLALACVDGGCQGFDVRQDPTSACATDDDCRLRNGSACCEECSGESFNLIAISKIGEAALKAAVCDGNEACAKCLPSYPLDEKAVCVAGHCQVQ